MLEYSPMCLNQIPLLFLCLRSGGDKGAWIFGREAYYAQTLLAHLWREMLILALLDLYRKVNGHCREADPVISIMLLQLSSVRM